jgi:hypothetical protein
VPGTSLREWRNGIGRRRRPRSAALLVTHVWNPMVAARWATLRAGFGARAAVMVAFTGSGAGPQGPEVLRLPPEAIFLPAYGAKAASRRVTPGNLDLVALAAWRAAPFHTAYWLIEYDVFFPSGAGALARLDEVSGADLLGLSLLRRGSGRPWPHWASVVPGTASPGPSPDPADHAGMQMQVSRWSAPLLATLDAAYGQEWQGHHEALVPLLAASAGLSIETLEPLALRCLGHALFERDGFHPHRATPRVADPRRAYHPVKNAMTEAALRAWLAGEGPAPLLERGARPDPAA